MKAKQIGALVLIVVMVFSMLAAFFTYGEEPTRKLLLKKDFRTVKDGLKLVPGTPAFVQFASVEDIKGTELESLVIEIGSLPPFGFYRATVTRALVAIYPDRSWVELHEAGYKEIRPNYTSSYRYKGFDVMLTPQGPAIVSETSPIIFGYPQRVVETIDMMNGTAIEESAYQSYSPLIERMKFDANFAQIDTRSTQAYDAYYLGVGYAGRENYHFGAVLHLNSSANATELNALRSDLLAREYYAKARNFTEYKVDFDREYAMVNATGSFDAAIREFQEFVK